jgi:hypothetical protein
MLELERYTLSLLREELLATSEEAERLVRALPKPSATRQAPVPTKGRKGRADA